MTRSFLLLLAASAAVMLAGANPALARSHKRTPSAAPATKPAVKATTPSDAQDDDAPPAPAAAYGGLATLNEAEARARLGQPDISRNEGAGAMWTYRMPDCALFVFFRSASGQPLRVSGAAAGPRRRGQAPVPVETCIAEALQSRAPAPRP
jgi:hypothetical protein